MDIKEMGRKGGNATLKKYGNNHFSQIAKKAGLINKAKGSDYFKKIRKGIKPNQENEPILGA